MARPIWHGTISFGLINIPVGLFPAISSSEQVHFHLLDKATNSRIHNVRVNDRGQEVAWENITHAYEFEKGKYVVVDQKMLEKTAASNFETVEIAEFVPLAAIQPIFFEKPYYLLPEESGIKGYKLLHQIMQRNQMAAIAKVVIKTREYLSAIVPMEGYLLMILLRYAQDIRDINDLPIMEKLIKNQIKIKPQEIELADKIVKSMSKKWHPKDFQDQNRKLLLKLIKSDIAKKKTITTKGPKAKKVGKSAQKESAEVLDFMELLKKSVASKHKKHSRHKTHK